VYVGCGGGARGSPGGSVWCVRTVPINMSNLFMLNLNYFVDPLCLSFVPT
jgi:hypothetical protein